MKALTAQELEELLLDYVYDELGPAERAAFEASLPSAPHVAAEVAAMRRTRTAMSDLGSVPGSMDLMAGMDAVFAEANAMAASVVAQQATPVAETPRQAPSAPSSGGFGAWLTKLARSFNAALMTPAFGAAAVVFLVAGVAVVMSRTGKLPGEDDSANSQSIGSVAPVALAEAPAAAPTAAEEARVTVITDAENVQPPAPSFEAAEAKPTEGLADELDSLEGAEGGLAVAELNKGVARSKAESKASPPTGAAQGSRADEDVAQNLRSKLKVAADEVASAEPKKEPGRDDNTKDAEQMWATNSGSAADNADSPDLDSVVDRRFAPAPSNTAVLPAVTQAKADKAPDVAESAAVASKPTKSPAPKPRTQTSTATPSSVPSGPARQQYGDGADDLIVERPAENRPDPAPPAQDQYARTSDGDGRRGAPAPAHEKEAGRQESETDAKVAQKSKNDNAAKVDGLWATLKRQQEAGDLAAAEKTLAALETMGADPTRIKAAKAHVADLKRQKAVDTKSLPATRSTK